MLQTKTKQKIGAKEYEMEFPNVGQVLEVENLKMLLSGNSYGQLIRSGHNTAVELLNLIDGVAYFSVLAPNFKEDFKIEDFTKIGALEQKQISIAFVKFWTWYKEIENSINQSIIDALGEDTEKV